MADDYSGDADYFSASIKGRRVKVNLGEDTEVELSTSRLNARTKLGGTELEGQYRVNGEWQAKVQGRLFGDQASFVAETDSKRDWSVNTATSIFGGQVSADAGSRGGLRRYYVKWSKDF